MLLRGADSSVGFDNVQGDPNPLSTGPIRNGDFSLGSFGGAEVGDQTTRAYPERGGNPGNYGVMTSAGAGFGIWVANENEGKMGSAPEVFGMADALWEESAGLGR